MNTTFMHTRRTLQSVFKPEIQNQNLHYLKKMPFFHCLPNPRKHMKPRTTTRCRKRLGSQIAGSGLSGPLGVRLPVNDPSSSSPNKPWRSSKSAMSCLFWGFAGLRRVDGKQEDVSDRSYDPAAVSRDATFARACVV